MAEPKEEKSPEATALQSHYQLHELTRELRRQTEQQALSGPHRFWDTQPVPKMQQKLTDDDSGPMDPNTDVNKVRDKPINIPDSFTWEECDIYDPAELEEIYILLRENYVEDEDAMFRFDYSKEFLQWALTPPGYIPKWHICVRVKDTRKMVAFLTAIPGEMFVKDTKLKLAEVNFLCVHKKLRAKRLAPVLIKEITRRVNLTGIWQAVYTSGTSLPKPIAKCRYFHRSLNPKKLVEINFSALTKWLTINRAQKLYRLPEEPEISGVRPLETKDIPRVHQLISDELKKYSIHPCVTLAEIKHMLTPLKNVIYSYVREVDGEVKDVMSFYSLPSSIIKNEKYDTLWAAYYYYSAATSVSKLDLMKTLLILAKAEGFDVFNALEVMDNKDYFQQLKFGEGDGYLKYYLFNWKCPEQPSHQIGLILL